ncbi:ketosynthase [Luteimonas sp. e5]
MLVYPLLAQLASMRQSGVLAALAGLDMLLFVQLDSLLRGRLRDWLLLALACAGLAWLASSRFALLPLLLAPPLFMAMIGWLFARSLRAGHTPLITRIVAAMDGSTPATLEPALYRYSQALTRLWAGALLLLTLLNLGLAMIAVPRGILASFDIRSPLAITDAQWSWFANWCTYGLIGLLFVAEYLYRKRRFPGRYRNALDFGRKLVALGPGFWRDLLR